MNNIIYFSKDVIEVVISIGNDKFRINTNEIKHFQNGTKFISKTKISVEKFYEFVNYLCSISNQWNDFYVRSIEPESRWSVLIKTNNNGTKRYSGIDYCPNNWQDFYNEFVSFIKNDNIILNKNESQDDCKINFLESINVEFGNNGITQKLINDITDFAIEIVEDYKQDRFWSDSARNFLVLLIISCLLDGNVITYKDLIEQVKDINEIKNIMFKNINKFSNIPEIREIISTASLLNSDKPLKSIVEIIEKSLSKTNFAPKIKKTYRKMENKSIEEILSMVDLGNAEAINELAYRYFNGIGIEKNQEKAYENYGVILLHLEILMLDIM